MDENVRFADLPGRPEVWHDKSTGKIYMVYFVPDSDPEIPMLWHVPNEAMMNEYAGGTYAEGAWPIDRQFSGQAQLDKAGALMFGSADEIVLRGENPFVGWADQFEREKEVLPWLHDPEVAAIWASSYMEGRTPSQAELASTDWFREKTGGEQKWLSLLWSQPETAKQLTDSNRLSVQMLLEQSGVQGLAQDTINYIADQWTQGVWTDVQRNTQIALLADPEKHGDMEVGLKERIAGSEHTTTIDQERYVSTEVRKWLGPVYGQWSEEQIVDWAGRLRNDPNAKDQFLNELSRQRQAVLPQYENPDLTYEDIATPWRNMAFSQWGQQVDESSEMFQKMISMNDAGEAGVLLRTEGLSQGVKRVEDQFLEDIANSFGGNRGVRGYAG